MANWYTADLHLQHRLVAAIRGFGTFTQEWQDIGGEKVLIRRPQVTAEQLLQHDLTIINNWNARIRSDDDAWVLGDLTLRDPAEIWDKIDLLNGRKHLLLGNHDAPFPANRGWHRHQDAYREHFDTVDLHGSVRLEGQLVMLSHFPYTGDRGADRLTQWRLRDCGAPVVHGHTHLPGKVSRSQRGTLQLHAGLDAWDLQPVPESWIMAQLRAGQAAA